MGCVGCWEPGRWARARQHTCLWWGPTWWALNKQHQHPKRAKPDPRRALTYTHARTHLAALLADLCVVQVWGQVEQEGAAAAVQAPARARHGVQHEHAHAVRTHARRTHAGHAQDNMQGTCAVSGAARALRCAVLLASPAHARACSMQASNHARAAPALGARQHALLRRRVLAGGVQAGGAGHAQLGGAAAAGRLDLQRACAWVRTAGEEVPSGWNTHTNMRRAGHTAHAQRHLSNAPLRCPRMAGSCSTAGIAGTSCRPAGGGAARAVTMQAEAGHPGVARAQPHTRSSAVRVANAHC